MNPLDAARALIDLIEQKSLGPISYLTSGENSASAHLPNDASAPAAQVLAWAEAVDSPLVRFAQIRDEVFVTIEGQSRGVTVRVLWAVTDSRTSYLRSHHASIDRLRTMVETGVSA